MSQYPPPPGSPQPPPPGYPANPPQGYGAPPPAKKTSVASIVSLVSGLLSCVPFVSLLAVLFGIVGIAKTRSPNVSGRPMAIIGLILGLLGLVWTIIFAAGGAAFWGVAKATEPARNVARQFATDLAAGDVQAAKAQCVEEMSTEDLQRVVDQMKAWGAVQDITLFGLNVSANAGESTQVEVAGTVKFANTQKGYTATLVKQGENYKIVSFNFQ